MQIEEIVGAIVSSRFVITDREHIDATLAAGQDVQLISRARARNLAFEKMAERWIALAQAPTLFVLDRGIRYRCYAAAST